MNYNYKNEPILYNLISIELLTQLANIKSFYRNIEENEIDKDILLSKSIKQILLYTDGNNYDDDTGFLRIVHAIYELEKVYLIDLNKGDKIYNYKNNNKTKLNNNLAIKYDNNKPDLTLISHEFYEGISKVREFGILKYNKNNWKKGFLYRRSLSACLRHIYSYSSGQSFDDESNLSHILHAICCLEHALYDFTHNPTLDDRFIDCII